MANENKQNQIQIEVPADEMQGKYATLAVITHGPNDFFIDMILMAPNTPKARVQSRVIMTPENAKQLLIALNENVRKYEQAFGEIKPRQAAVVACGGGTPCYGDNMALMNRLGTTVWLTTSPEVIATRLALPEHKFKRPTIAPLADEEILPHVIEALDRRTPYYAQAQLHFDATAIETAAETLTTAQQLVNLILTK